MKKVLFIFLLFVSVAITLVSCGGEQAPEHIHNFTEWITTKNATCTENGEMVRYCSCGEKQTEVVVANGAHIEVVDAAVAPTCTEAGLTEGKHCAICNEIFLAQTVVQKLEHTLDADGVCALCDQPIIPTEGIAYKKSEDGTYAMVVGYNGTASKIRIADTYEGLPVKTIYVNAFYQNKTITSVIIPDGVTYIGNTAFGGCRNITSIMIPDSVTTIDFSAFSYCSSLTSVVIPDSVTYIGGYAFSGCSSLTSAVIPDGVTTIRDWAFSYCSSLTSVVIPDSVTYIGGYAFSGCSSLTSVEVDENNKYYKLIDGNLYTKDGKTLVKYATGKTEKNFVIPDGVTTIGDSAFSDCSNLTSVVIPNGVTSIGDSAFDDCSSLTSVVIPNSVITIGMSAFYECSSLTSVVINDSVTTIGHLAFRDCSSLTSVVIGDSVTTIGNSAFYGCSSLTSVVLGDSVTTIGDGAFSYCSKLKFNEYENGKYLGTEDNPYFALIELTTKNLSSYTIHEDTKIIADEVFLYCSGLTSVVIPDSVTTIGDFAFESCSSLTSVVIGDSVTTIGDMAFRGCSSLTSVVIGDSVSTICAFAFFECSSLTDVYYTGSEEDWGEIAIGLENYDLTNATIHYDYVPEE